MVMRVAIPRALEANPTPLMTLAFDNSAGSMGFPCFHAALTPSPKKVAVVAVQTGS